MAANMPARLKEYITTNAPVVQNYIETLATYGAQPEAEGGGIIRPVYSPAWLQAHRQLAAWMAEAGLQVKTDAVGNLWGRLEGQEPGPAIASGSHIDTVKQGGKYDGSLGVIAALSAIRFLKELYGPPRRSLEVVALCEEEGSRFNNSFLGSRALTGSLPQAELNYSKDPEGISIAEAARSCGFQPEALKAAERKDIKAFIELHIEQGRVMEEAGVEVGIVKAITGLQHLLVTFSGRADHAGTTPMDLRKDALVPAAEAVIKIKRIAAELGRPAVATVGSLNVEPNARNIVPARVIVTVDLRHADPKIKEVLAEKIRSACLEAGESHDIGVDIELLMDRPPAQMSFEIVEILSRSAEDLGYSQLRMVSGAGHDSQIVVERIPTAMIFVPSQAGRSHSAAEYTPIEQIVPGLAVLARALYRLAY